MVHCTTCQSPYLITDSDLAFYAKLEVPKPRHCPPCREKQRLLFRNERYYYQRQCDLCHKAIVSVYDPARVKNVYCHRCWWSDDWDPKNYGKPFDFKRPFFEQYGELLREVPKLAMMNDDGTGSENCEYTYDISRGKNSYLVIGSWYFEDSLYNFNTNHVKNCVDNYFVNECEFIYNSLFLERCHSCQECLQCYDCVDCIFGFDLKGCKDCLLSAGLRHKQYYIGNKPYTKEEYFKKKEELRLDSWSQREAYRKWFQDFILQIPRRFADLINCENCTGDHLRNSKNARACYYFRNLHDCAYMVNGDVAKDCHDCNNTGGPELCYHCITPDNSYGVTHSVFVWKSQHVNYSDNCHTSHDLFGCVGMKRGAFCILNKNYEEDEYHALRQNIIEHMKQTGEWGEFFPKAISPFAYNETSAQEFYPLDEKTALAQDFRWQPKLPGSFEKQTISWEKIPNSIENVSKSIVKEILSCTQCEKNFKIIEPELRFYKNQSIPIPRLCIDCRYYARKALINPRKLWERQCGCDVKDHGHAGSCSAVFQTTYGPERPAIGSEESDILDQSKSVQITQARREKILCEDCYGKTAVG